MLDTIAVISVYFGITVNVGLSIGLWRNILPTPDPLLAVVGALLAVMAVFVMASNIILGEPASSIIHWAVYLVSAILVCWFASRRPGKRKKRLKEAGAKVKALLAKLAESITPARGPLHNPA